MSENKINAPTPWEFSSYTGSNGEVLKTVIHIPKDYDKKKSYPLFIYMHGLGSVGSNYEHFHGTAEVLRVIEKTAYFDNTIIIAPQHEKGKKWVSVPKIPSEEGIYRQGEITPSLAAAEEFFFSVIEKYSVDKNRIYGFGNSMGAYSLWDYSTRHPDFFAAIVPLAGGGDPSQAYKIKDLPVWAFHGDCDKTVSVNGSALMVEAMKKAGAKDNLRFTVYPGAGHGVSDFFYPVARDSEMLNWIFNSFKLETPKDAENQPS